MRLIEADGKNLLRAAGLPVPAGRIVGPDEDIRDNPNAAAIKAQLLAGGRGKAGLVRVAGPGEAPAIAAAVRAQMRAQGFAPHLLMEEAVTFERECYLAWLIDDVLHAPILLFSLTGGSEVEAQSEGLHRFTWTALRPLHPHHLVGFFRDAGVSGRPLGSLARFATEAFRAFQAADAELLEINPLAITASGGAIALDVKLTVDDNASFRHRDRAALLSAQLESAAMTPLERRAAENGFTFVELTGDIALAAGGAGFGMAIMDLLDSAGMSAANFADTTGGGGPEAHLAAAEVVFERARDPAVRAIVSFQTLSATSLKPVLGGLMAAHDRTNLGKPLVAGFACAGSAEREMTMAEARAEVERRGQHVIGELDELVPTLLRLLGTSADAAARPSNRGPMVDASTVMRGPVPPGGS